MNSNAMTPQTTVKSRRYEGSSRQPSRALDKTLVGGLPDRRAVMVYYLAVMATTHRPKGELVWVLRVDGATAMVTLGRPCPEDTIDEVICCPREALRPFAPPASETGVLATRIGHLRSEGRWAKSEALARACERRAQALGYLLACIQRVQFEAISKRHGAPEFCTALSCYMASPVIEGRAEA